MPIILNVLEGEVIFTNQAITGNIANTSHKLNGNIEANAFLRDPDYEGSYEIIPSSTTQILSTSGKRMTEDLIIDPIPSNYGRIEYDGSVLTVS